MAQSAGYLLATLGPFGMGLLHSATGSWTLPLVLLLYPVILERLTGWTYAMWFTPAILLAMSAIFFVLVFLVPDGNPVLENTLCQNFQTQETSGSHFISNENQPPPVVKPRLGS